MVTPCSISPPFIGGEMPNARREASASILAWRRRSRRRRRKRYTYEEQE